MQRQHIVVLTGAGISAESGLKTFRDSDGLWMGNNISDVATPRAFKRNPELVLEFYNMRRREVKAALPNSAHFALAKLEEKFDVSIITQNIDDLHERGGSTRVLHLHGEIFKMRGSVDVSSIYPILEEIRVGDLAEDGSQLRPAIVWFEEPVPLIETAAEIAETADIFILVGTSLQVYPAAGLIDCVPEEATKYIIDKKLPPVTHLRNLQPLERSATEGMAEVLTLLGC